MGWGGGAGPGGRLIGLIGCCNQDFWADHWSRKQEAELANQPAPIKTFYWWMFLFQAQSFVLVSHNTFTLQFVFLLLRIIIIMLCFRSAISAAIQLKHNILTAHTEVWAFLDHRCPSEVLTNIWLQTPSFYIKHCFNLLFCVALTVANHLSSLAACFVYSLTLWMVLAASMHLTVTLLVVNIAAAPKLWKTAPFIFLSLSFFSHPHHWAGGCCGYDWHSRTRPPVCRCISVVVTECCCQGKRFRCTELWKSEHVVVLSSDLNAQSGLVM